MPPELSTPLHICPVCDSKLVQPEQWKQTAVSEHWKLWRRCPECEWRGEGTYGPREIDAYDMVLDDGLAALTGELKTIETDAMLDLVDTFTTALERDLITADDFK